MRHLFEQEAHASGRRIAVIGAGIAGLSAAWLLSRRHHVTLYERNSWLGGHAHTVDVACPEGPIPVDTGFIVYNPRNYPNFTAMLDHLGVPSVDADMAFAASIGDGRVEYSSTLRGLLAQPRNWFSRRYIKMIAELLRFYRHTNTIAHGELDDVSLGDFLERARYADALVEDHVLPMCAAIWSTTPAQMRAYPMRSFLRFFTSHGLLQVFGRPTWRTVKGGSRAYVEAMRAEMRSVAMRPEATSVTRRGGIVVVEDRRGVTEIFTDVVIAGHADEALGLLTDPSTDEQNVLGAFHYTPNVAVLHDDRALMPKRKSVWASWNFIGTDEPHREEPLCVSYWMNALQSLETERELFLTLNPVRPPRPASVIDTFSYTHPLFDAAALSAQDRLWELQGQRNTWFCGSYFGYGFHEDALQSGLAVAEALGVARPWGPTPMRIASAPAPMLEAAE